MASVAFNPLMHPPRKRAVVAVAIIFLIMAAGGLLFLIVAADADFPLLVRALSCINVVVGFGLPAYAAATLLRRRLTRGRWLRSPEEWRADAVRREESRVARSLDKTVRWVLPAVSVICFVTFMFFILSR